MDNKFVTLLKSRKLWASLLGILAAFGVKLAGNVDDDTMVQAIMVIVSAFVGGTAIESGLTRGKANE